MLSVLSVLCSAAYPCPQAAGAQPVPRRPQAAAQQIATRRQAGRTSWSPRRKGSIPPNWRPAAALWRPAAVCRPAAAAAGPAALCGPAASFHRAAAAAAAAGASALRTTAAARPAAVLPTAVWAPARRPPAIWPAAICRAGPRQGAGPLVKQSLLSKPDRLSCLCLCPRPLSTLPLLASACTRQAMLHAGTALTVTVNRVASRAGTGGCWSVGCGAGRERVPDVAADVGQSRHRNAGACRLLVMKAVQAH